MRANQITDKTEVVEYDSLHEFYEYLIHTIQRCILLG